MGRTFGEDMIKQSIVVENTQGQFYDFDDVLVSFGNNWLLLEEEYTESELAPIPKRRFVAAFPIVNLVSVFPQETRKE